MAFAVLPNLALTCVSTVVPAETVSYADELSFYGDSPERARRFAETSGLHSRRVAAPGVTASDLCIQAAEVVLNETGVDRNEIGALIFISHSPDYLLPPSAAVQQHALGLASTCVALDMNVGCAGFVAGLWAGAGLISAGACSKFLLLMGDTPNRFLDPANRVTLPVFGDAGSAALLEYRKDAPPMSFLLGTDGGRYEALVIPGGGSRIPHRAAEGPDSPVNRIITDAKGYPWTLGGYAQIWMDGLAIYSFSMTVVPPHIERHLALAGLGLNDVDHLLLHPANKIIVEAIANKLDVNPAKTPCGALAKYGNVGAASLPALMCDLTAEGLTGPQGRTLLCGFGSGLSWASCLLSLDGCRIAPVREYSPAPDAPSREERIAYWHAKFAGKTRD